MKSMLSLALFGALGCTQAQGPALETSSAAIDWSNGTRLNGTRLNGTRLNGTRLNGTRLNGTRLNGTRLNGTELVATDANGVTLRGEALVGSVITGDTDSGPIDIRIDSANSDDDLWFYRFSAFIGGAWSPVCESSPTGVQYDAILAVGLWNQDQGVVGGGAWTEGSDQFTIACRNSAIAKCHLAGYRPWLLNEVHAPNHLLSCVRMIRADYCGNGAPWTADGREIDIWDNLNIQVRTQPTWTFEASWTADGAACLESTRLIWATEPACVTARKSGKCSKAAFTAPLMLRDAYAVRATAASLQSAPTSATTTSPTLSTSGR